MSNDEAGTPTTENVIKVFVGFSLLKFTILAFVVFALLTFIAVFAYNSTSSSIGDQVLALLNKNNHPNYKLDGVNMPWGILLGEHDEVTVIVSNGDGKSTILTVDVVPIGAFGVDQRYISISGQQLLKLSM